ncbi:MAG: hypothetical protein N4A49_06715 [Marinifilaceae bacterium]|jgi:hypothetical protein|nr:hypothetical protein [Marinifilaceae bacterium]
MEFNSKEYTYCDMNVIVGGKEIIGLRGIEYKSKKNKEVLFGRGGMGKSIQHGKREYDGTLTVLQSEIIALDQSAKEKGFKDCLDLDFQIIITYMGDNGVLTMDKVLGASLTEVPKGLKEGDMNMEIALPFIALDVKPNLD